MGVMANARGFAADNRIRVFVAAARPDVSFADQIGAFLHNEGFQPLLDRYESGGGSGIRTHGGLASTLVFKTSALNHSAIPPEPRRVPASQRRRKRAKRPFPLLLSLAH